nr:hypothetical protein CFP56_19307 [Quercus suber]
MALQWNGTAGLDISLSCSTSGLMRSTDANRTEVTSAGSRLTFTSFVCGGTGVCGVTGRPSLRPFALLLLAYTAYTQCDKYSRSWMTLGWSYFSDSVHAGLVTTVQACPQVSSETNNGLELHRTESTSLAEEGQLSAQQGCLHHETRNQALRPAKLLEGDIKESQLADLGVNDVWRGLKSLEGYVVRRISRIPSFQVFRQHEASLETRKAVQARE